MDDPLDPRFRDLALQREALEGLFAQHFDDDAQVLLHEALYLAEEAHEGQTRDEGDPYLIHPVRVARNLLGGMEVRDTAMAAAALLHDVVEDNPAYSFEDIATRFGKEVAALVRGATQDKARETKAAYIARIMEGPREGMLVKVADKLDNVRSLLLRRDRGARWQRHLAETEALYLPLARKAGNAWALQEMERYLARAKAHTPPAA